MRALDKKLLRDLWGMRAQVLAIVLVVVSGISTYVMSLSVMDSLQLTQAAFYRDNRFADVFASLKRAPESLKGRIAEIPGVERVETRVMAGVKLRIEGYTDPITGLLASVPDSGEALMNALYLRQGRRIAPGADDEVVISESFAGAHGLVPGSEVVAVINGRKRALTIVGVALSPEFIYQLKPGSMIPDFERYGILWMGRTALGTAYDMDSAFNDVSLGLSPGANEGDVLERLDILIRPYGGLGAYGRKDQTSHRFLSEEFRQLGQMATIFPVIFLAVAAFLLNVVMGRLVHTEREQVAALKAFGYSNLAVAVHYVKMVLVIMFMGIAGGVAGGVWLGKGLGNLYMEYYRFPFLVYRLEPGIVLTAAAISTAAALLGTLFSIWRAASIPPAQAMRPEPPATYRVTLVERIGLGRLISAPTKMVLRHLERKPVLAVLTVLGMAMACSILIVGMFFGDSVNYMIKVQFELAQREDLTVAFVEPTSRRALQELEHLPGVNYGEVFRIVPARFRFGHRSYRTVIQGVEPGGRLMRLLDSSLRPFEPPSEGIVITDYLGKLLGVVPGDRLTVEVLEGSRPVREVTVAGFVNQYIGVMGYMERKALNRLMREGDVISGAYLSADEESLTGIYEALHGMPRVAGADSRVLMLRNFRDTMSEQMLTFAFIITLLASVVAFGVVYNSARVSLSERSRELASLRVLGFTRGEISYILLGELALLTVLSLPIGFLLGRALGAFMVIKLQTDLFRVPLVIEPDTYAFSAAVVLVSALLSALVVRRRLNRLDLVAVLKTKE